MNLFVANTSTQPYVFTWTLPESPQIFHLDIAAGSQTQILRDASDAVYDFIVEHHRRYGMLTIAEAKKAGTDSSRVVLVYSDKPLPADVFGIAEEVNEEIAAHQIQRAKEEVAYGMIKNFEMNADINQNVKEVELEIIEQTPKENDRKGKPLVNQKFTGKVKA